MEFEALDFGTLIRLVQKRLEAFHLDLWRKWDMQACERPPAQLLLCQEYCDDGYHITDDAIHISIPEGNRDDVVRYLNGNKDYGNVPGWFVWEKVLVHETVHEYQNKFPNVTSEAGIQFKQRQKYNFFGYGHNDAFYSVIVLVAGTLDLTPDDLLAAL